MSLHDEKYEAALKAVNELHNDRSVGARTTISSLRNLRDELDIMIDALRSTTDDESEEDDSAL